MAFPLPPISTRVIRQGLIQGAVRRGEIFGREMARPGGAIGSVVGETVERGGKDYLEEEYRQEDPYEQFGHDSPSNQWATLKEGLQDPEQVRAEPNKFLSMLGTIMKPLSYIDIPIQLASEAVLDTAEMFIGKDSMDWIQGTDESRELFAGWKAIGKSMRGEASLVDAANEIAGAFELKPLWSQIAFGFASGGAASSISRMSKLGKLAKPLAYTLDPSLAAWHVVKPAGTAGIRALGLDKATRMQKKFGPGWRAMAAGDLSGPEAKKLYHHRNQEFIDEATLGGRTAQELGIDESFIVKAGEFKPFHNQYNGVLRLKKLLLGGNERLSEWRTPEGNSISIEAQQSLSPDRRVGQILMARDSALLELQQLTAGRPGQVEQMKLADLEWFLKTGIGNIEQLEATGRARAKGFYGSDLSVAADAMMSVQNYLDVLKTTDMEDGRNLYDTLVEDAGKEVAEPFRAISVELDPDTFLAKGHKLGVNVARSNKNENLITSQRLQFYNRHFGDLLDPEGAKAFKARAEKLREASQATVDYEVEELPYHLFPDLAQPLRALVATREAAKSGATPDDIQRLLGHAAGSPDEYLRYVTDADIIDIDDAMNEIFGVLGENGIRSGGYFEDKIGITQKAIRMGKDTDPATLSDKIALAEGFDFDEIANTWTREYSVMDGRVLSPDKVDMNVLMRELEETQEALAVTKAKGTGAGTRKGAIEKGLPTTREYDEYAYAIANVRFHRLLNSAMKDHTALSPLGADILENFKGNFDLGFHQLDDRDQLLLEALVFETVQSEVINLNKFWQRIDMRKRVALKMLEESGWVETAEGSSKKLLRMRQQANGEYIAAPDPDQYASWLKRRGVAGEIDLDKAWRLFGAVRKGDLTEFAGIEKQFQDFYGEALGKQKYSASITEGKSWLELDKATRRMQGRHHAHELMVAGLHVKQKQLLVKLEKLRSQGVNIDTYAKNADGDIVAKEGVTDASTALAYEHPVFNEAIYDLLVDGTEVQATLKGQHTMNPEWQEVLKLLDPNGKAKRVNIGAIRNAAIKPYKDMIVASNELTGIELLDFTYDQSQVNSAVASVRRWLGADVARHPLDPDTGEEILDELTDAGELLKHQQQKKAHIVYILNRRGIARNTPPKKIRESLEKAFIDAPMAFGTDIMDIRVKDPVVQKRLDMIAQVLVSDDTLLKDAEFPLRALDDVGQSQELASMVDAHQLWLQTRRNIMLDEHGLQIPALNGRAVRAMDTVGWIPNIHKLSDMINNPSSKIGQKMLGIDETGMPLPTRNRWQKMWGNVATSAAGGAAARGLGKATRYFIARKKGYEIAEQTARQVAKDIHIMLHDTGFEQDSLGFYTEAATKAQALRQGTTPTGNQYFGNIKTKRVRIKNGKIVGWEDGSKMSPATLAILQDAQKVYRDTSGDFFIKSADDANFRQWDSTKTIGDEADEIAKLMTQVDVILGYVPTNSWDEIYELSETQQKQLAYLQNITARTDDMAEARGYDIQRSIDEHNVNIEKRAREGDVPLDTNKLKKKKAEYLKKGAGYIPWLRKIDGDDYINRKLDVNAISNNFEWWLQAREDENIFHVLRDVDRSGGNVMMDLEQRLAQYVESMHKHVIDLDTNKALKAIARPAREASAERKNLLDALRRILNQRNDGKVILDLDALEAFDTLKNGNYELFTHPRLSAHVDALKDSSTTPNVQTGIASRAVKYAKDNFDDIKEDIALAEADIKKFEDVSTAFSGRYAQEHQAWLRGLKLERADVDQIREHLSIAQEGMLAIPGSAAKFFQPAARFMRTFKAGFDLGVTLIHGYNALVTSPIRTEPGNWGLDANRQKAWGKAAKEMIKFLFNPDYYDEYMAQQDNLRMRQNIQEFVVLGHSEPLAALQDSNTFTRWRQMLSNGEFGPIKSEGLGKAAGGLRLAHRMEASFVGYLDVLRMNLWSGMVDSVKREYETALATAKNNGQEWDVWADDFRLAGKQQRQVLTDLGATVNKMTGVYDRTLSGLTPTQSAIENSFLFFAPAYRRATYGVIADLFHNINGRKLGEKGIVSGDYQITRVRNREAFRQLSGVVASGLAVAAAAEYLFGNEGAADPTSSNFGKFEINGTKMGFGGAWQTVFKLTADLATVSYTDPEGDVFDYMKDHPALVALGRRGRSQMAPPAALLTDIIKGKTYLGDPLRDLDGSPDWSGIGLHTVQATAYPFWMDSMVSTDWATGTAPTATIAELMGLQAWEVRGWDEVLKMRRHVIRDEQGLPELNAWRNEQDGDLKWDKLPKHLQKTLEDRHAGLRTTMNEFRAEFQPIARGDDRTWIDFSMDRAKVDQQSMQRAAMATTRFEKGAINGRELSDELDKIKYYRYLALKGLFEKPKYIEILEKANNEKDGKNSEDIYYGDAAYESYIGQIAANPNFTGEDGEFLFDKQRQAINEFKQEWNLNPGGNPEIWEYIQSRKNSWYADPEHGNPIMQELEHAKDLLSPYWQIYSSFSTSDRLLAKRWLSASNERQKGILRASDPKYDYIAKKIAKARADYRLDNPTADWFLVKYYNARPVTQYAHNQERLWRQRQQGANATGLVQSPRHTDNNGNSLFKVSPAGRVYHEDRNLEIGNLSL